MSLKNPHQTTAHLGDLVVVVTANGKHTNKTGMRLWFECEVATVVGVSKMRHISVVLFARDWRVERRADLANLVALVPYPAAQINIPLAMMAAREHGKPFGSLEEVRAAVRPFVLVDLVEGGYDPSVGEPAVPDAERYALRDEYVNAERTTLAEQLRALGAEQAAQDAEADAFHAQRRADEAEANGECVDYEEAEAVREIDEEIALEAAGVESWDQL